MKTIIYLVVGIWFSLVIAVSSHSQSSDQSASATAAPESLSTRLGGLDTLGVMPTDVETPYEGGTRRVHLESTVFRREDPIVYSPESHRDPFRPLISDKRGEGEIKTDLLVIDGADLTGVVWAEGQYMAILKDKDKRTFFLREGDPVYSGRVIAVTQTHIVVEISGFGDKRQVTLKVNN